MLAAAVAFTLCASGASAAVSGAPAQVARARSCAPEAFGAKHDGVADDTAALQKALDACADGGAVRLGAGTYLSGPLFLHSHQTLEVAKGAVLQATSDHARFLPATGAPLALVNAKGGQDIALVGEGVIDGAGQTWWPATRAAKAAGTAEPPRPRLILLSDVDGLVVRGLTLQNSPTFHLVPQRAHNVLIEKLDIHAPADSPNTDGIDPSGRDMLIQDVVIDTGDDNIAIKSGQDDPAHPGAATANIVVRNSTFRRGHGLSIGSETNGGVKDIVADNITFDGTATAIRIKTARGRGGPVRDVVYRNIRIANVGQAVLITAYYPKIPAEDAAQPIGPKTPDISGVRLEHVQGDQGIRKLGAVVGLPERAARGIVFEDVTLSGDQPLEVRNAALTLVGGALKAASGEAIVRGAGADIVERSR